MRSVDGWIRLIVRGVSGVVPDARMELKGLHQRPFSGRLLSIARRSAKVGHER